VRVTLVDEPFDAAEAAGLTVRDTPGLGRDGPRRRAVVDEVM
jgi:hypothetical protein